MRCTIMPTDPDTTRQYTPYIDRAHAFDPACARFVPKALARQGTTNPATPCLSDLYVYGAGAGPHRYQTLTSV